MAVEVGTAGRPAAAGDGWYARSPEQVAADLGVDPAIGLSPARAAELLTANGPNALLVARRRTPITAAPGQRTP